MQLIWLPGSTAVLKVLPWCPMFMLQFLCKTEKAAVDQHSSPVSVCPPKSLTLPTSRESRALDGVYVWQTCRGAAEATKPISTRSSTCLLIIPVCLYHSCCDQSEVIVINRNTYSEADDLLLSCQMFEARKSKSE